MSHIIYFLLCIFAFISSASADQGNQTSQGTKRHDQDYESSIKRHKRNLTAEVEELDQIFEDMDMKIRNLTDDPGIMKLTAETIRNRTTQIQEKANKTYAIVTDIFESLWIDYKNLHSEVQRGEIPRKDITFLILPYLKRFQSVAEKLNELYQRGKITSLIKDQKSAAFTLQPQNVADDYKQVEDETFKITQKIVNITRAEFPRLHYPSAIPKMFQHAEDLMTMDPKDLKLFHEVYFIQNNSYVMRKLVKVLTETEAILKRQGNPFQRKQNTMRDQKDVEWFD